MKKLIIQGYHLLDSLIDTVSTLSQAKEIVELSDAAIRFNSITESEALYRFCQDMPNDWAILDQSITLEDYKLLASDMDSTLITIECIDELADICGVKPKVAMITEAAMRGEIDFKESLVQRVDLLAGLEESALYDVYQSRLHYHPGAKTLIKGLKAANITTLLVSGGFSFFTERVITDLGMDAHCANELEVKNGKLTGKILGEIIDAQGKADALMSMRESLGLKTHQTIALGDGANDLIMMEVAGLSVAYRAKPRVMKKADIALNHVGLDGLLTLLQ